jgi:hypothetical protein
MIIYLMVLSFIEIDDLELEGMNPSFIKNVFIVGFVVVGLYIISQTFS